jgi:hypothetical protein
MDRSPSFPGSLLRRLACEFASCKTAFTFQHKKKKAVVHGLAAGVVWVLTDFLPKTLGKWGGPLSASGVKQARDVQKWQSELTQWRRKVVAAAGIIECRLPRLSRGRGMRETREGTQQPGCKRSCTASVARRRARGQE